MTKLFSLLTACLFLLSTASLSAQKKVSNGQVVYEITDISSDMPEAQMMKGSELVYVFSGNDQKIDMSMMGGMMRVQSMFQAKADKPVVLMDMMGKKVQLDLSEEEAEMTKPDLGDIDITYLKSEKKEIAGYKCSKAKVDAGEGVTFEVYLTDKINPAASYFQELFKGIEGFPLQFYVEMEGVGVTLTAQSVTNRIDASAFEVPAGYEMMTAEEFSKSMGGGMGF